MRCAAGDSAAAAMSNQTVRCGAPGDGEIEIFVVKGRDGGTIRPPGRDGVHEAFGEARRIEYTAVEQNGVRSRKAG